MRERDKNGRFASSRKTGGKAAHKPAEKAVERGGKREENKPLKLQDAPPAHHCRSFTKARVAEALPHVVQAFLEKAKDGSVPHFKALTALGGLDKPDAAAAAQRPPEKNLEEIVMEEWCRAGGSWDEA